MKRKILIPIVLLIAILAIAGVLWSRWMSRDDNHRILVSGNIELTQVDISFKVPGKLIERTVDEGDFVKKGQLIARIDRDQVERQHARDQAGVFSAESQLAQGHTSVALERATLESDLALRRAELRQSEARLAELLAGSRPQEIQQARAAVVDAQAQYDQAKQDWERGQKLFKDDDISAMQYDQYRTRFNSTAALLKQAQEHFAMVQEGPRKEDIEAGRADVERAQAAVKMSEANRLELERRQQDLVARRNEIDRARAQMAMTETQINDTTVFSPIEGVVLVKSAETGEVLAAGTTVVSIGDIDHPWLRGYVNERDLGRVKLGMQAKVTSDSYPGKAYRGRIGFIASEAEFTPKQIQTQEERVKLVYRIKIDIDNPQHELKSNMPVDAEILLDQK